MIKKSQNQQEWNEFQWEREIRKDEKRINQYFQVLPNCLDLPGEEDIIMKKLMSQPDLVPTNADWNGAGFNDFFYDDDDDFFNTYDLRHKHGSEFFIQIEKLAVEWNVIFASELRVNLSKEGLALICQFGKLLSRSADIIEIEDQQMAGLKISLAKRTLADINDLVGRFKKIRRQQRSLTEKIALFIERLQDIREKIIDIIADLRQGDDDVPF